LPVLEDWPELPEIQKEMRTSQNLELAFWELPLDLVVANKGRVDTQVCNQMNFVMLWGIYAGYRRTFLSAPKDDSVRDQWARLLVTLDVGMDFQGALGRACRHSLRYARYLWGDTLTHRQFNWNFSSLSKTINILSDSMIWFENQKDPFVVSLRYNSSDGYVKLGSLSKAPPLGNWNRNRPQRSRR
jgi:hypothetical protein